MSQLVLLDGVWKRFPLRRDRPGFKEFVLRFPTFMQGKTVRSFWALKDVNLQVLAGQCLGIIGKNGAGKSTLLSLVLGTMSPSKGNVTAPEDATPLLELGSGFHPDLTGRENIFINGVLLGLTKEEVSERLGAIIAFSEIGEFIDMPLRVYSSGMYLRLAFSIVSQLEPTLLLIDEILSVGDEAFQRKCKRTLVEFIRKGVATIIATHDLAACRELCDRAIWLDHGEVREAGEPDRVVAEYLKESASGSS